jgi:hypothetical protein
MRRATWLSLVGLTAVVLLAPSPAAPAGDKDKGKQNPHAQHFMECAKACNDCQRECDSCAHHCAHLVAEGKKDHLHTLGTCLDCASMCATSSQIVSRMGPLSGPMCEACVKACAVCAEACEKHPADEHMKRCGQECRKCEKACKEMLKHVGHAK